MGKRAQLSNPLVVGKLQKLVELVKSYKPKVGSGYVTYIDLPLTTPDKVELGEEYSHVVVESGDHPLVPKITPRWQRRMAIEKLDRGDWYALVLLYNDDVIGHFWLASASTKGLFNGVMNLTVIPGEEVYGFDLFLHPDHRRGKIGNFVAWHTITLLQDRGYRYGYTHVLSDNVPSIFWHHGVGFNIYQSFNYINIGPRIWWKLPFSETPMYGPLSRKGRFNDPDPPDAFGGSFFPS